MLSMATSDSTAVRDPELYMSLNQHPKNMQILSAGWTIEQLLFPNRHLSELIHN